jgi:hypothetical protein
MNETLMERQMRRIEERIPEIVQGLQSIVWGFQNGEREIFIQQIKDFAANFVRTAEVNDTRTEQEKEDQAKEVVNAINTAASIVPIEISIKAIFDTTPGGEVQKSDAEKVRQLLALIRSGIDAIKQ